MGVNFFMINVFLEKTIDSFCVLGYLFDKKLWSVILRYFFPIKLDDISIVKIANFFKTSFINIPFDIFINFSKLLKFSNNFLTNLIQINLIKTFTKHSSINSTKSINKKIFD